MMALVMHAIKIIAGGFLLLGICLSIGYRLGSVEEQTKGSDPLNPPQMRTKSVLTPAVECSV